MAWGLSGSSTVISLAMVPANLAVTRFIQAGFLGHSGSWEVCAGLVALATALFVGLALPAKALRRPRRLQCCSATGGLIGRARPGSPSGQRNVGLAGDASYLYVSVSGGTFGDNYTMIFAAAPVKSFTKGCTSGRSELHSATCAARIEISGSGRRLQHHRWTVRSEGHSRDRRHRHTLLGGSMNNTAKEVALRSTAR